MESTREKIGARLRKTGHFLPYIEEIRFPMYKALEDDLRITFDYPITALIGANGTNKSSILQAISAAPEGRSLAQYWFSTAVDDIDRGPRGSATHRFIYRYRFDDSGVLAECRKYRGSKKYRSSEVPRDLRGKRDPDYWEPTKRVDADRMDPIPRTGFDEWLSKNRDRWNQVKKPVLYLDFRAELSAFDKYIHHQSFSRWTPDSTQKRYRVVRASKWIARALNGQVLPKAERGKLLEPVRELDTESVQDVATILGKPVIRVEVIAHRFFGPEGYTVRLHLQDSGAVYSEAHAGSGEYAVIRLVDAIRNAPDCALVLLDEPEVSLHPGAQVELMKFIERETLRKCLQVVASTHSPIIAAGLPDEAIKVFAFDASRNRVVLIANSCSPTEAFSRLGQIKTGDRPRLIVEDKLAAEIVRATLRRQSPGKLDALDIIGFPGGSGGVVKSLLPSYALSGIDNAGILLDGDQKPTGYDPKRGASEAARGISVLGELKLLWNSQFHETVPNLHADSDRSNEMSNMRECLRWADRHLGYLRGSCPEQALAAAMDWDDGSRTKSSEWKDYWIEKTREGFHLTSAEEVTAEAILSYQQIQLAGLAADNPLLAATYSEVSRIIDW